MTTSSEDLAAQICGQISAVFTRPTAAAPPLTTLVESISAHRNSNIFLYGVGREGLMLKALCMRLFHLGLKAHVIFDMTTPPITSSDLLIASAGPGGFATVDALVRVARGVGAGVVMLTAQPDKVSERDVAVAHVPAKTMAEGEEGGSVLPMGSLYEGALFVLFEMVVYELGKVLGEDPHDIRARHTNLE